MDRHILLTVSDDSSSLQAVRFVAGFFAGAEKLHLTLLYVAPNPKAGLTESEIIQDYGNLSRREAQTKSLAQTALDRAEELLVSKHFPKANIHKKITFKQLGTANDIIQEGITGVYDAIALGRRGLSRLEELIDDSVSKQVFTTPMEIPLWICRSHEKPAPGVLLCTDGSPASLRCADHVGFMLANAPEHEITLLHVACGSSPTVPDDAIAQARRMLEENGVAGRRIHQKIATCTNIAEAILRVAREGEYGVLATGRTGRGESRTLHLLGSVSMNLLKHLESATLWICH
ncbi:universal stress protein [Desulfomicrobium sp. ZS1]|jgi:nucleotide-binding universal stress UspA family protein|uniref:universal stress protein n=1 Tax=Desulfomicrobium sp. ZS1 TaxID=2952228 RepID=UPI0020B303B9|nr:universal stress protein [Desulfomicrobium sp. ZS1]UTF51013.1 universal stress protein [Desulfomicrobium sp. ZS1]